ncbi:probable SSL1 - TFIIH subunit (transcription initiation factor), factor B [Melanopsichium pennsylvanicum]|uniref:General transcription and DNA repair factor IIH n=1 Tax=Melanopsichium pennsylvanicum TaxID=63383 RepID=A0AAJ4XSW1_9BASI|nr:probable SSL1 - TFIIH subunit (transcription initiation factor), factor B [Melanopsichium pennsylvanicum]
MPPRIDEEYVDDGGADDAEDYLDDDDSGDEYRSVPSLPKLASLRTHVSRSSAVNVKAGTFSSSATSSSSSSSSAAKAKAADLKSKSKTKDQGYSWEATYKRSWDTVAEDDSGSLESAVRSLIEGSKRRRGLKDVAPVQRGIIRHLVLLIDLSASMLEKDMRPNRFDVTLQYAREFVNEYFDQNPIGQLSIIGTREGIAERLAMMGGNTVDHTASLSNKRRLEPRGEPSLQNALEMARSSLVHLPASNSREVLAIFGSLTTCDPGNIHDTIDTLVKDNIRVSVVHLAAEVKVFKDVCTKTGGTFSVALNEGHFHDSLFELVAPPAVEAPRRRIRPKRTHGQARSTAEEQEEGEEAVQVGADLLQMAFPLRLPAHTTPTLCACHSKSRGSGYICPRCGVKVCDVPTDCPVCGITIVMSTHLARSYHHLFPVPNWKAVAWTDVEQNSTRMGVLQEACLSCNMIFPIKDDSNGTQSAATNRALEEAGLSPSSRYRCGRCGKDFCLECDAFVHEVLHVCPGCC